MVIEVTGENLESALRKAIHTKELPVRKVYAPLATNGRIQERDTYEVAEGFSFKVSMALIGFDVVIGWDDKEVPKDINWVDCEMLNRMNKPQFNFNQKKG